MSRREKQLKERVKDLKHYCKLLERSNQELSDEIELQDKEYAKLHKKYQHLAEELQFWIRNGCRTTSQEAEERVDSTRTQSHLCHQCDNIGTSLQTEEEKPLNSENEKALEEDHGEESDCKYR